MVVAFENYLEEKYHFKNNINNMIGTIDIIKRTFWIEEVFRT